MFVTAKIPLLFVDVLMYSAVYSGKCMSTSIFIIIIIVIIIIILVPRDEQETRATVMFDLKILLCVPCFVLNRVNVTMKNI